jgi:hypothetical protein
VLVEERKNGRRKITDFTPWIDGPRHTIKNKRVKPVCEFIQEKRENITVQVSHRSLFQLLLFFKKNFFKNLFFNSNHYSMIKFYLPHKKTISNIIN